MSEQALKLTVYHGERERAGGGFLADALSGVAARLGLATSLVLRGMAGFGANHLRTDRLLTLSEDLPMASVAVDRPERIGAALAAIDLLRPKGLVTLERARLVTSPADAGEVDPEGSTKLTLYLGRHEQIGRRRAYEAVVELLRSHGVAGATVLLGVDGTAHGVRHRARFVGANVHVPLMVVAVGSGESVARALADLGALLPRPLATLERVRVLKRDGAPVAEPGPLAGSDANGLGVWQKLTVFAGEQSRHRGRPLTDALLRELRAAGAAGATALRGIWGYHGESAPHGDRLWQLRRRVPVVTVVVDTPERMRRWLAMVDDLTDETGLVTVEAVPAFRATGPDLRHGGLVLAEPWGAPDPPTAD